MARFLRFEHVSFSYPGMASPLLEDVDAMFPEGTWTGVVGANGTGKTTLLRLAAGELAPSRGSIRTLGTACYAVQRTDEAPADFAAFAVSDDPGAREWRNRLGVRPGWADRWETLSHGERKRAQIGTALWHGPEVLALDEPTNHLDADAKAVLLRALRAYRGAGLLVSHDRAFLDALCGQCLFLFPPKATMRPGGVTQGLAEDRREQAAAREKDDEARDAARRRRASSQRRRELAEQTAARHKAAKNRKPPANDHDGKAKRQLAKLTGKDSWAVSQSSVLARRAGKLEASRKGLAPRKEYEMGFWLEGSGASPRNFVLSVDAGTLPLGGGRTLSFPALRVGPTDRIALAGPNGIGKSTLLRHLLPRANVPGERLLSVPQEITEGESRRIHAEAKALPKDALGRVMTSVSRLGSRPGRLLASECPSPGEIRKLLLALGVDRGPHLVVMDEPTNHLDLPSIECLEEALAECPCAMILVSHDETFLSRLATVRWELAEDGGGNVALSVARNPSGA
jgi:ATPase subunit of ABC transporter with duplicated ATPase domains